MPRAASARSIASHTVRTTSTRAHRLSSAATTCHGPAGWSVRSSISSTAASYSARLSRLRQSSSVSFHALYGSSRRASKRRSCSSGETCIQNLTTIVPSAASVVSRSTISP